MAPRRFTPVIYLDNIKIHFERRSCGEHRLSFLSVVIASIFEKCRPEGFRAILISWILNCSLAGSSSPSMRVINRCRSRCSTCFCKESSYRMMSSVLSPQTTLFRTFTRVNKCRSSLLLPSTSSGELAFLTSDDSL